VEEPEPDQVFLVESRWAAAVLSVIMTLKLKPPGVELRGDVRVLMVFFVENNLYSFDIYSNK